MDNAYLGRLVVHQLESQVVVGAECDELYTDSNSRGEKHVGTAIESSSVLVVAPEGIGRNSRQSW